MSDYRQLATDLARQEAVQQRLLRAAKEARRYLAAKISGAPLRGMYDDLSVVRELDAAILAVEAHQLEQMRGLLVHADPVGP